MRIPNADLVASRGCDIFPIAGKTGPLAMRSMIERRKAKRPGLNLAQLDIFMPPNQQVTAIGAETGSAVDDVEIPRDRTRSLPLAFHFAAFRINQQQLAVHALNRDDVAVRAATHTCAD